MLPYAFSVKGIPHGCRTLRTAAVVVHATFAIPEANLADAPLVMRWKLNGTSDGESETETRWFDGRLYRPVSWTSSRLCSVEEFQRAVENIKENGYGGINALLGRRSIERLFSIETNMKRWFSSNTEAVKAIMEHSDRMRFLADDDEERLQSAQVAYSESLLVLQGIIWTSSQAEPTWRVGTDEFARSADLWTAPAIDHQIQFRADQLDLALRFAYHHKVRVPRLLAPPTGYVEVERPDLLTDEVVLLCECLFEAMRACITRPGSDAFEEAVWGGCSAAQQELGRALCNLVNSGRPDRETALRAFDAAKCLREAWACGEALHPFLHGLRMRMLPILQGLTEVEIRRSAGLSDEEENELAAAFDDQ